MECLRDISVSCGPYFYGWKLTRVLQKYRLGYSALCPEDSQPPCLLLLYLTSEGHFYFLGPDPSLLTEGDFGVT